MPALASTNAPVNDSGVTISGGDKTIPPRVRFAATETLAARLRCSAHNVPEDPGAAAGKVGSHRAPSSSVTPLELRPGNVPPGLSATTASGLYWVMSYATFVPALTVA